MTAITIAPAAPARRAARPRGLATWATLAGRRIMLSAHTPREVLAPLVTPLLFALVIAPALARMIPEAPATAPSSSSAPSGCSSRSPARSQESA